MDNTVESNVVDFSALKREAEVIQPSAEQTPKAEAPKTDVVTLNQETLSISPAVVINALKCIDAAAQRGAFQGGELSAVGNIRDNLYTKVAHILEALPKQNKG